MGPVRRLVVAEVEGGPPREEQRHELLAGRVVAELLRQVVRDAEPLSGVGEVAFGVGSEPDQVLCEHAREEVVRDGQAAGDAGDRDRRLPVAGVGRGEAGEVEQLERALLVDRRHLRRRAQEEPAGVGRHAAGHLDEPQEAVDVSALDRLGDQQACALEQRQRPLRAPREPGALGRRGQSPRPVSSFAVRAAARSRASDAAANPPRSRALRAASSSSSPTDGSGSTLAAARCQARRSASASPSRTLASAPWAAWRLESGAAW